MPIISVFINKVRYSALVDTGSTSSVLSSGVVTAAGLSVRGRKLSLSLLNGVSAVCSEVGPVDIVVQGEEVCVDCVSVNGLVGGCWFEVILGMDAIRALGGVCVQGAEVTFGGAVKGIGSEECPTVERPSVACGSLVPVRPVEIKTESESESVPDSGMAGAVVSCE